ncbi:type II toxin-antitoxin system RelE/ParE family toxin [Salinisphaera sp. P385]|uniref:Type II toxin-antitoxin system RelE/ParE family toxin n=1 Tax=Spectribacter acetivorans TaxID=3075603 RepID=A0ABU3B9N3_9GAMM|nr:type II toxin-antitoxin system RelE/ParE family toxin [Salinisphaera sp. P385]MDT0619195.1 type II toxin-antitoxin system RelE/ParE family toxin [Salinisphaera sp. P385]
MKPVRLLRSARADLRAQNAYYRGLDSTLGRRFLLAVDRSLAAIPENPQAMAIIDLNVRRWPVTGFPHGILYRENEQEIIVLGIFHPQLDPKRWRQRLRE